jgi:hypothetical protein
MAVQHLGCVVGLASAMSANATAPTAAKATAADEYIHRAAPERAAPEPYGSVALGVMTDAGVPDGANAALVLRLAPWLRAHAGGGTNTISAGYRGGLTFMVPYTVSPSLSFDFGHFRDGNANGLVRSWVGGEGPLKPLFERFGYTYVNAQLGLEIGRGPVQFFVHAGLSHINVTLHNANAALVAASTSSDPSTTVVVREDPVVRAWVPSVKMGLLVYFGGKP